MILKVNVISDKRQLDRIKAINALPGLISFIVLLISTSISESLFWIALVSTIIGLLLIYFPFYLNGIVEITPNFFKLESKKEVLFDWKEVKSITVELEQVDFSHNYIRCNIDSVSGSLLSFYLTRDLFNSKEKQLQKLLNSLPPSVAVLYK